MKWRVPDQEVDQDSEKGCTKDCLACKLNKKDAMDHSKWRKLIKNGWWLK